MAPKSTTSRERLIDAARELFWEKGYEATSVADILERADVNAGSLYYFFEGKEAVLEAVIDRHRDRLDEMILQPAIESVEDPFEKIFAILDRYRDFLVQHDCSRGCPMGNLGLELSDSHPRIREKISEVFDFWCERIESILEAAEGRLPDIDRAALARFILTVMEGAVMQARVQKRIEYFDSSVAALRDYLEQSSRKRGSRKNKKDRKLTMKVRAHA